MGTGKPMPLLWAKKRDWWISEILIARLKCSPLRERGLPEMLLRIWDKVGIHLVLSWASLWSVDGRGNESYKAELQCIPDNSFFPARVAKVGCEIIAPQPWRDQGLLSNRFMAQASSSIFVLESQQRFETNRLIPWFDLRLLPLSHPSWLLAERWGQLIAPCEGYADRTTCEGELTPFKQEIDLHITPFGGYDQVTIRKCVSW